jgi:hypothetical protein
MLTATYLRLNDMEKRPMEDLERRLRFEKDKALALISLGYFGGAFDFSCLDIVLLKASIALKTFS